jgi:Fe-S cluster assembly protein SufD
LAEQQTKPEQIKDWLIDHILDLLESTSFTASSDPIRRKLQKNAKEVLAQREKSESFGDFAQHHRGFFREKFPLQMSNPVVDYSQSLDHPSQEITEIAGVACISSEGISVWLQPSLQQQGVIFGDLQSIEKDHPGMASALLEKSAKLRRTPIAIIQQSLGDNTFVLFVPKNLKAKGIFKLEISCSGTEKILPVHLITNLERAAEANLSILHNQPSEGVCNRMLTAMQIDYFVAENSFLRVFHHQDAAEQGLILVDEYIQQEGYSQSEMFSLDTGGAGLEKEFTVELKGEGAESIVSGVYRPGIGANYYYNTEQIHSASHTVSDLQYNGVLGENAFTSWKGNIVVEQKTSGANGYQSNNNLIIDGSAKVESVPGLEILTDDVRCSHGVTISNIDKNHMFYLQSRGINIDDAEDLIIEGFLRSTIKRIKSESFLNFISQFF